MLLLAAPLLAAPTEFNLPRPKPHEPSLFEPPRIERGGAHYSGSAHELGDVSLGGSIGMTFSPIGFLATAEADFYLARFFSIGPLVQFSVGDALIFGVTGGLKLTFDFVDNDFSDLVKPYVQAGIGLVVFADEHRHGGGRHAHGELGLLLTLGPGVDFYLTRDVSLGTGFLFNIMPTTPLGEVFYFGWKMIEARYHF
jgi:hypothetical protein